MTDRPYVLLSAAMSVDGYLDDTGPQRLLLSDAVDRDRVDEVRAGVDAILIGATTMRRDDPGLSGSPLPLAFSGRQAIPAARRPECACSRRAPSAMWSCCDTPPRSDRDA